MTATTDHYLNQFITFDDENTTAFSFAIFLRNTSESSGVKSSKNGSDHNLFMSFSSALLCRWNLESAVYSL